MKRETRDDQGNPLSTKHQILHSEQKLKELKQLLKRLAKDKDIDKYSKDETIADLKELIE